MKYDKMMKLEQLVTEVVLLRKLGGNEVTGTITKSSIIIPLK
jgi:hypothetical protein